MRRPALATDSLSVSGLASQHIYYDSGWVGFAVPVGTQNLIVSLTNADPYNRPIGLLDYTPAAVTMPGAWTADAWRDLIAEDPDAVVASIRERYHDRLKEIFG